MLYYRFEFQSFATFWLYYFCEYTEYDQEYGLSKEKNVITIECDIYLAVRNRNVSVDIMENSNTRYTFI